MTQIDPSFDPQDGNAVMQRFSELADLIRSVDQYCAIELIAEECGLWQKIVLQQIQSTWGR